MISKIQKFLTSVMWRHNHRKFSDGPRNNYMQAIALPEWAFEAPLFPAHSSHLLYVAMDGLGGGGGAKTEFVPGRGKP